MTADWPGNVSRLDHCWAKMMTGAGVGLEGESRRMPEESHPAKKSTDCSELPRSFQTGFGLVCIPHQAQADHEESEGDSEVEDIIG